MYIFVRKTKEDKEFFKEELDMPNITRKIVIMIYKIFRKVTIKKIDKCHYLYLIYCPKNIKKTSNYIEKKIKNIIKSNPKAEIVLSKELKEYKKILSLERKNKLIKYFIIEVLDYILSLKDENIENQNISVLVNKYNEENCNIIKSILKNVKTLTIVTNNINSYKRLEDKLYKEKSILITVTNNKRKALKNTKYIINFDFGIDQIKEYLINRNAIIINCSYEKIDLSYFQGIIVNDIELKLKEDKKEKYKDLIIDFAYNDIIESFDNYKQIFNKNKINSNENIKNLIGNNGIISNSEFE